MNIHCVSLNGFDKKDHLGAIKVRTFTCKNVRNFAVPEPSRYNVLTNNPTKFTYTEPIFNNAMCL